MGLRNRLAPYLPTLLGAGAAVSQNGNHKSVEPTVEAPAETVETKTQLLPNLTVDFIPADGEGATIETVKGQLFGDRGLYAASVLAYAAMSYRAKKLSEAPLFVAEETDDGEEWLSTHELAELLQYPNEDEEMADLLEALSFSLDRTGKALFVKDRDRIGRPGRLTLYAGDEFTVHQTADRIYGEFRVQTDNGLKKFGPEEVVFIRLPHPTNRWEGLAPLDVLATHLRIEAKLLRGALNGIDNSVVPGLVVIFPQGVDTSGTKLEEFGAKLQEKYASAKNRGRAFAVGGGADVKQLTTGFADLAGGDLYREIESAVCVAFGLRPEILAFLVGLENSPWSHMETAQRLSYDEAIIPAWRRIERAFTRQLLRPVDADPSHLVRFDTTNVRALQADADSDAKRSLLLKGIATRNQRRQIAGLEPMEGDPEFWDEVETAPAPVAPPVEDGEEPGVIPPGSKRLRWQGKALPKTPRDIKRALFAAESRGHELAWTAAMVELLELDRASALELFDRAAPKSVLSYHETKEAAEDVSDWVKRRLDELARASRARWEKAASRLVLSTGQGSVASAALDLGISFELLTPGLRKYTQREAAWLVKNVLDTTKQAIRDALDAGLKAGETIPQLRKRIADSGAFAPSRAELIARTETTRVSNGAQVDALKEYQTESGTAVLKSWLATNDSRTRPHHREMDGEEVGIDEEFSNGLTGPSEPNCRCSLTFRLGD